MENPVFLWCEKGLILTNPRILYFVPEAPLSQAQYVYSQVLAPACYLSRNGFECMFIGSDVSDKIAAEAQKNISRCYGIQSKVCGCYSNKISFLSHALTVRRVFWQTKQIIRDFKPTHIYTRGFFSPSLARKIAKRYNAIHVHDVRGMAAEEWVLMGGKKGLQYFFLSKIDLAEIRKADRLSCVSTGLKNWIKKKTNRDDVTVIPCCTDVDKFLAYNTYRDEIRKHYNIADEEKVICYLGGLCKWQRIADIINLFLAVSKIHAGFKFLFITPHPDQLKEMIRNAGLPLNACISINCSYEDVPRYLMAADAGIIMRDSVLANKVACPIKIGEYLACGLPVILTKGIGDFDAIINQAGIGILVGDNVQAAQQVVNFMQAPAFSQLRNKAVEFCKKYLAIESYLDEYRTLFR